MAELPQGTVTFLFTDIEGSTRLLRQLGDRYPAALAEHRRILREAAEAGGGREVDTQGDAFFFAFPAASAALRAAVAGQRALAGHDWGDGGELRVRMGVHTGEPVVGEQHYVGLGVHRAARIAAVGHGGQVLLSGATRELLESEPSGAAVRELGLYWLKDFDHPERLYQLDIEGLPSKFPPLRAKPAAAGRGRLLLAVAASVAAVLAVVAAVAFTRDDSTVEVGPTSVAVIDPDSKEVVDAVDLGFESSLIAAGEGYVWVVDPEGSILWRIDPRTHEKRGFALPAGAGEDVPFGVAAGEGAVWVAVLRGSRPVVEELGPEVGELRHAIFYGARSDSALLGLLQPLAVGAGAVWAVDPGVGTVWRIDPSGVVPARKLKEGLNARALAAGGGAVWVASTTGVTKVDAVTGVDLGSAPIGSPTFAETASVALGEGAAWVVVSSGRTLSALDPRSVAVTRTHAVGRGPSSVAVGEGAVWVANSRDGTVTRVDPRGDRTTTITLGNTPGGVVARFGAVWTSPSAPRS